MKSSRVFIAIWIVRMWLRMTSQRRSSPVSDTMTDGNESMLKNKRNPEKLITYFLGQNNCRRFVRQRSCWSDNGSPGTSVIPVDRNNFYCIWTRGRPNKKGKSVVKNNLKQLFVSNLFASRLVWHWSIYTLLYTFHLLFPHQYLSSSLKYTTVYYIGSLLLPSDRDQHIWNKDEHKKTCKASAQGKKKLVLVCNQTEAI